MALGIALRYVLEALRKPFGSKMYMFGIAALDRFKTRYAVFSVEFGSYFFPFSIYCYLVFTHSYLQLNAFSCFGVLCALNLLCF